MRPLVLAAILAVSCGGAGEDPARGLDGDGRESPTSAPTAPAAIASPAASPSSPPAPAAARQRVEVISVTDGDTIRVRIDGQSVPVRYIGIDTAETVDPRKDVQCFGREASAFNAQLVAGKTVELEKDVSETDRFGRLLRYVYVDGKMVNEELVRGGYARSSSYPPDVRYQERFRALEAEARARGVGLWAENACAAATPSPTPTSTAAPTVASTPAPTTAAFSVTITVSTYGTIRGTTTPGATCTASARLPRGNLSRAAALSQSRTADGAGSVVWSYGTSSSTTKGTGTHTVTCTFAGQSRSASAPFTVQ